LKTFGRLALAALAVVASVVLIFVVNVVVGMRSHARDTGTISGLRLAAPVQILRDDRGVPHVIAANEHDLFFAQGYVEGSDRLFQMDTLRRYILGELAEVYGPRALSTDDGKVIWQFNTAQDFKTVNELAAKGGSMGGPGPVVADGMLYVTSGYANVGGGMPGNVLLAFSAK